MSGSVAAIRSFNRTGVKHQPIHGSQASPESGQQTTLELREEFPYWLKRGFAARRGAPRWGPPRSGRFAPCAHPHRTPRQSNAKSPRGRHTAHVSSEEADLMAAIVAEAAPLLREAGFQKRRHSFNRQTSAGLVHVVYFWMAPKEPPAWTEVPGLRERRYGSFRLDFGVWVPQITRNKQPRGTWINEYNCDLRATIGWLMTGQHVDFWWELRDPHAQAAALDALVDHGLPWLNTFPHQDAILTEFQRRGPLGIGLHPAGPLDIAQMCEGMGNPSEARRILEDYVSRPVIGGHVDYLRTYLVEQGYPDLANRVTVKANADA